VYPPGATRLAVEDRFFCLNDVAIQVIDRVIVTIEDRVRYLAQNIPRGPPEPIGPNLHAPAHGFEYLEAFIEAHRNDQALAQEHADPANLQGLRAGPIASTREPDAQRVAEGLDAGSTWALDRLLYSRPLYLKSAGERVEFFLMRLVQDDTREVVGSLTGL
jgi:hypothetical protein